MTIEAAREQVYKRAQAMLAQHERATVASRTSALVLADGASVAAESGLVMTSAQDLGFFARSANWRCTGCGEVQAFGDRVPVTLASPCRCASIEFEPQQHADASPLISLERKAQAQALLGR